MTLYVCHTGTDTWFALSDTAYIFDDEDMNGLDPIYKAELEESMDNGYAKDVAYEIGVELGEDELKKISKMLKKARKK
jgi:hypothetical protein